MLTCVDEILLKGDQGVISAGFCIFGSFYVVTLISELFVDTIRPISSVFDTKFRPSFANFKYWYI